MFISDCRSTSFFKVQVIITLCSTCRSLSRFLQTAGHHHAAGPCDPDPTVSHGAQRDGVCGLGGPHQAPPAVCVWHAQAAGASGAQPVLQRPAVQHLPARHIPRGGVFLFINNKIQKKERKNQAKMLYDIMGVIYFPLGRSRSTQTKLLLEAKKLRSCFVRCWGRCVSAVQKLLCVLLG